MSLSTESTGLESSESKSHCPSSSSVSSFTICRTATSEPILRLNKPAVTTSHGVGHRQSTRNMDIVRSSFYGSRSVSSALDVCVKVIKAEQRNETVVVKNGVEREVFDVAIVSERVSTWVQRWGKVVPVPPVEFLHNILTYRGYETNPIPSLSRYENRCPSEKQIRDYDNDLVWAIRNSDLPRIKELHSQGRSLSACNRFSESIVHMACRRSSIEVIKFLLDNGADITISDDYGRTPLHDACWRPEPCFDIVALLLNHNLDLLRFQDVRGFIPLHYVREEHWLQWCAFFFNQIEKYWAPREPPPSSHQDDQPNKRVRRNSESNSDGGSTSSPSECSMAEGITT
jgi:hypothetical protein